MDAIDVPPDGFSFSLPFIIRYVKGDPQETHSLLLGCESRVKAVEGKGISGCRAGGLAPPPGLVQHTVEIEGEIGNGCILCDRSGVPA